MARFSLQPSLTLSQVLVSSFVVLIAALVVLFTVVFRLTQETQLESSRRIREQASREIAGRLSVYLAEAPEAIRRFETALGLGLVQAREPRSLEPALASLLAGSRNLGEVTLTAGRQKGFDADDDLELEPGSGAQWSFVRSAADPGHPAGRLWRRRILTEGPRFAADEVELRAGAVASGPDLPVRRLSGEVEDPTKHPTFTSPTRRLAFGELLSTDLHYSQIDAELPENKRRVALGFMQALRDRSGEFVGVLRVGLLTEALDRAVQLRLAPAGQADPHRIFVCDNLGRLITRTSAQDKIGLVGEDDLRVLPAMVAPEISAAMAVPELRSIDAKFPSCSGSFQHAGEEFLVSFLHLPHTQGWVVGVVVPSNHYLGRTAAVRERLLTVSLVIMGALVAGGIWIQHGVRRAQRQIARETQQMNAFEFGPASTDSAFRDISEVLESLERAKSAMRAMSKYVPIDLVRRLYQDKSEPVLGGEQTDISIMFTDIKDFTHFAERLEPNVLADALGRYLSVMARIIQQEHRGTIDKFIGDAVMTIWNAPEPIPEHARMACLAALRCKAEAHALALSPEWEGLPPFETRFGLHRDTATVGHFGAPDRLNYTAIGDAVNLASRLESLNKQYGTSILVSERIRDEVGAQFEFRRLDRVAVKGKSRSIVIFELLGLAGAPEVDGELVQTYERAFDAYTARDFAEASRILAGQLTDPPSAMLHARCQYYLEDPPAEDWGGVYVALTK